MIPLVLLILCISRVGTPAGMDPADSSRLVRLEELRSEYDPSCRDRETTVEMAHLLHDLRRDKPALRLMETVPVESLGPSDRLFLASLHLFDSDIPSAFAVAAPVCIVPLAVTIAAAAVALILVRRRKGADD